MKTKILSSTLLILIFLLTACGGGTAAPVTHTPVATQPPTETPTQTPILFSTLQPSATAMPPYPTASVVKANAVAFTTGWDGDGYPLWVANVDGSGEKKLTHIANKDSLKNVLLQWSPNGEWISYGADDGLWLISHDGSTKRKLLSFPDKNLGAALVTYVWNLDGSKIIFENTFFDKTITPMPESWPPPIVGIIDIVTEKITVLPIHDLLTSLTPDGHHILLSRGPSFIVFDINNGRSIEIKPKDTSTLNQCTAQWYDQLIWSWSSNGQWFVYSGHGNGPFYNRWLCVGNLDGNISYEINLEDVNGIYAIPPAWDKTGAYLYLVVRNFNDPLHADITKPDLRLIKFNIKTRKVERLLLLDDSYPDGGGLFWQVSISPNGEMLELDTRIADKYRVDVIDLSSMSIRKFYISEMPITYSLVYKRWSADSRYIVFSSNYFYWLDVQTGKTAVISGEHSIKYWAVSPIATTP